MICKKCGANMPDGMSTCAVCGGEMGGSPFRRAADLGVEDMEPGQNAAQTAQPQEIRFNMGSAPEAKDVPIAASEPKRYCGDCGAVMDKGARFCISCGKSVDAVKPSAANVEKRANEATSKVRDTVNGAVKGKSRKQILIIGGAVVAIALVIGIILFAFVSGQGVEAILGRSAETTVKKYIDASYCADIKAILKLVPNDVVEYWMEGEGYDKDEYDEFCKEGEDALKKILDSYEDYFGDDWEYSYEIVDMDDVSSKKLRDIQEEYEDEFGIKVKAAQTAEVEITIEGGDVEKSVTQKLYLIQVGNLWYLDFLSMGGIA